MINFTKMHGTGNDYIYVNNIDRKLRAPEKLAAEISDRHFGAGSDGLILIEKSGNADFGMRIFNSDGSEAEMCGNGIRCFAKYLHDKGLTKKKNLVIETLAGLIRLQILSNLKNESIVKVDMGEPVLERGLIPMTGPSGTAVDELLTLNDGSKFNITSLSMGNPHAVIFVEDIDNFPVAKYGPEIENHDLYPNRTNVEFVKIVNEGEVIQRTWERGAGETLSCGTGASAVTVAGVLARCLGRKLKVNLAGGTLFTEWDSMTNRIFLTGPAVKIFDGTWKN